MDVSAGLIIIAVLAGLLCLRRRRCAEPLTDETDEADELRAVDSAYNEMEPWRDGL